MSGHQSPVECVSFDNAEEVVVAGATGGTVKLWDLEQAKGGCPLNHLKAEGCLSVTFLKILINPHMPSYFYSTDTEFCNSSLQRRQAPHVWCQTVASSVTTA